MSEKGVLENTGDFIKDNFKILTDGLKERVYSPMYFYFIIAWIFSNWKFVYSFLFVEQETVFNIEKGFKVNHLANFYSFDSFYDSWLSLIHLLILPAIGTFIAVWWLSIVSRKFYKKTESNKKKMKKVREVSEIETKNEIEILRIKGKQESIKQKNESYELFEAGKIQYNDNNLFNEFFDQELEKVYIGKLEFYQSQVLFDSDYEGYRIEFNEWSRLKIDKIDNFINAGSFSNKHVEGLEQYINYFTEDEIFKILSFFTKNSQIIADEDVKQFIRDIFEPIKDTLDQELKENIEEFLSS